MFNSKKSNTLVFYFLMVASLFFIWGFCHAMLDVLNKHFQNILHVSKTQSGFIQTSVFGAYFLMAMPSAFSDPPRRVSTRYSAGIGGGGGRRFPLRASRPLF